MDAELDIDALLELSRREAAERAKDLWPPGSRRLGEEERLTWKYFREYTNREWVR